METTLYTSVRERLEAAVIELQGQQDELSKKVFKVREALRMLDEAPILAELFEVWDEVRQLHPHVGDAL